MLKAVIFDIDGVIVDSEPLHMEALRYALNTYGYQSSTNGQQFIGLSLEATIQKFGINGDHADAVKQLCTDYYVARINKRHLRQDVLQLWKWLKANNVRMGCVSSAELKVCRANIETLGFGDSQDVPLVGFESVMHTKPHPLPYLTMMEILGVTGDEVLVIEDSDTGICSAAAAGVKEIYGWPHGLSGSQTYQLAKQVIGSLAEVDFFKPALGD